MSAPSWSSAKLLAAAASGPKPRPCPAAAAPAASRQRAAGKRPRRIALAACHSGAKVTTAS
eukprot:3911478-Pyramimonas_sp.AAC.1